MKKNLEPEVGIEKLAVSDRLLAANLQEKFGLQVVFEPNTLEIVRGIRSQFYELVQGLSEKGLFVLMFRHANYGN